MESDGTVLTTRGICQPFGTNQDLAQTCHTGLDHEKMSRLLFGHLNERIRDRVHIGGRLVLQMHASTQETANGPHWVVKAAADEMLERLLQLRENSVLGSKQ